MPMIPLSWLRDHVDVPQDALMGDVASDLVKVGLEEEVIHPARVIGPVVVGRVLSRHEESQSNGKLINYCRVDVGQYNDEPGTGKEPSDVASRGIICGAHNFDVDDLVVAALPGAVLPGPFPISARKTYGHISDGMMCSKRELGLGEDGEGIIILTELFDANEIPEPGSDVLNLLGLGEEVLEINVTPDRGYCFSMRGVGREYALSTGATFVDRGTASPDEALPSHSDNDTFPVVIDDDRPIRGRIGCDRFVTRIVRGVNPDAQTPKWMVDRLEMAGMRSISLPVDVTNYVMLDLGQPMHAYDAHFVQQPLVVRRAREGERLTTLDETERVLDVGDLLITDSPDHDRGSRPVALAGVMGGLDGEISAETTDLLLEAAHFDPISVTRTARRHRLTSESAKRFERGTDPALPLVAIERATCLLARYGGGQADPDVYDLNETADTPMITLKVNEPSRLVGVDYTPERIQELLEAVGCVIIDGESSDEYQVQPPSWRPDLRAPADLVEEIARLDGYDAIPSILPRASSGRGLSDDQKRRRVLAQTLAHAGFVEVESYPFISADTFDRQRLQDDDPRRQALRLRNPLAEDHPFLRTSILDSLLDTAARNYSRGLTDISIFETGMVAHSQQEVAQIYPEADHRPTDHELEELFSAEPAQPWHIGGVVFGSAGPTSVLHTARSVDWADAVDAVQRLAEVLGAHLEVTRAWLPEDTPIRQGPPMPVAATDPMQVAPWHPGRVARLFAREGKNMVTIALAGELQPDVCESFGIPKRSAAFEMDVDALLAVTSGQQVQVAPISTYPMAKEDLALVVDSQIPASRVEQVIRQGAGNLLEKATLFDVYEGDQIPPGHRSLAYALRLRAGDHTLSSDEVSEVRQQVITRTKKVLGAELRS